MQLQFSTSRPSLSLYKMSTARHQAEWARRRRAQAKALEAKQDTEAERRKRYLSFAFLLLFGGTGIFSAGSFLWSLLMPTYTTLEVSHVDSLKRVFFSGEPWLVMCSAGRGYGVNSIFEGVAAAEQFQGNFNSALMNCSAKLPSSGKTVIERFKLDKQKHYSESVMAFTVANGGKPKLLPPSYLVAKQGESAKAIKALADLVKRKVSLRYGKVTNQKQLEKFCLKKSLSAIVLTKGKASDATLLSVQALMREHRLMRFCVMDFSKYSLSLPASSFSSLVKARKAMAEGDGKLMVLKKPTDKDRAGSKRKSGEKASKAKLLVAVDDGVLSDGSRSEFLKRVQVGDGMENAVQLVKGPRVKFRRKSKSKATSPKAAGRSAKARKKAKRGARNTKSPPQKSHSGNVGENVPTEPKKAQRQKETAHERARREARIRENMERQAEAMYAQAVEDHDDESVETDAEEKEDVVDVDEEYEEIHIDEEDDEMESNPGDSFSDDDGEDDSDDIIDLDEM